MNSPKWDASLVHLCSYALGEYSKSSVNVCGTKWNLGGGAGFRWKGLGQGSQFKKVGENHKVESSRAGLGPANRVTDSSIQIFVILCGSITTFELLVHGLIY